jgi:signal transduction histidine kinase
MSEQGLNFEIVAIFFVYGLAFFSMGLVLVLESRRTPRLAQGRVLRPLGLFGLVHGSHEWLEMLLLLRVWFGFPTPAWASLVRLFFLVISFTALLYYGLLVRQQHTPRRKPLAEVLTAGMVAVYLALILMLTIFQPGSQVHWVEYADALGRYTLAVPGAFAAGVALFWQGRQAQLDGRRTVASGFWLAAVGFGLYGLSQAFVTPVDFFLGRFVNTVWFQEVVGFPVQLVRAANAVLVTVGLIRAIQAAEVERQQAFLAEQRARLIAMEQVQHELEERESLRRDLLRHMVLLQEEERARISRELHDETAQFLTAMSLDLATLRQHTRSKPEVAALLDRLQTLGREVADGIYRMVRELRPAQLDDLGLPAALQNLAEIARRTGLEVDLEIEGPRQRLEPLVETVIFRVAQGALINVERHAQSRRASLRMSFLADQVILQVTDWGVGFDLAEKFAPPHGWGLVGMRERAESIGGLLSIDSEPGKGTRVQISVPSSRPMDEEFEENAHENHPAHVGG